MDDRPGLYSASQRFFNLLDRGDAWLDRSLEDLAADVPYLRHLFHHHPITSRGLFLACVALLAVWIVPPVMEWLLRRFHCLASNFRGERIPQAYGLVILCCAALLLRLDAWIHPAVYWDRMLWLTCISSFSALGLLDDVLGDKTVKGLRGHMRALVRERRVTTGLIKAAGGLIVALWIGHSLHDDQPGLMLLSAGLIALGANALNLLDLRPGRACGAFGVTAALLLAFSWRRNGTFSMPELLYVAIPTLVVWTQDADARVMLGDTGSNLLGASLGLAVCTIFRVEAQLIFLLALVGLHLIAERVSLTQVIEKNRFLSTLDRLTGVRSSTTEAHGQIQR